MKKIKMTHILDLIHDYIGDRTEIEYFARKYPKEFKKITYKVGQKLLEYSYKPDLDDYEIIEINVNSTVENFWN